MHCGATKKESHGDLKVSEYAHRLWVFGKTVVMTGEPIDPCPEEFRKVIRGRDN
jgi:hypothetical protein